MKNRRDHEKKWRMTRWKAMSNEAFVGFAPLPGALKKRRVLVAVGVVVDVASTLQSDCVLGDRATLRRLGLGLRLANSRL
jgi:hypothetical protein